MDVLQFKHEGFVWPVSYSLPEGVRTFIERDSIDYRESCAEWEEAVHTFTHGCQIRVVDISKIKLRDRRVNLKRAHRMADLTFTKDPFFAGVDRRDDPFFVRGSLIDTRDPEMNFHEPRLRVRYPGVPWIQVSSFPGSPRFERGDLVSAGANRYFLGLSPRTNAAGVEAVRTILTARGFEISVINVTGAIHLDMMLSRLAPGVFLVNGAGINPRQVEATGWGKVLVAKPGEEDAVPGVYFANGKGPQRVQPKGFDRVSELVDRLGTRLHEIRYRHLALAESGVACILNQVIATDEG